ncbi:MAG: TVP38/TMEM64 family protein [Bacillota bacterium]|nr:TVP38/TMEM64 family protein [Bacillota bacterium]
MKKIKAFFTKNWLTTVIIIVISVILTLYWNELKSLYSILSEGSIEEIVLMIRSWGIGAPIVSVLLMILQAFIAPIPSFLITGANGVIFGFYGGVLISWFGAMLGAAGTFYLARVFGEKFVKKFEKNDNILQKADEISQKHGAKVIFVGRLLPFVSFDFLSYAAGLSSMKPSHFFVATAFGMLPGTIAYVMLGNQIVAYSRYSGGVIVFAAIVVLIFVIGVQLRKRRG